MYVGFGNASGKVEPFDITLLAAKGSLYLTRPTLFAYTAERKDLLASAAALFDVIANGVVKVHICARFSLSDARKAHEYLESRQSTGSILLVP